MDTSNAAVPATCGADMLVPRAPTIKMGSAEQPVRSTGVVTRLVWVHAAHTNTLRRVGNGSAGPAEILPPGAATLMTERPKLVYDAGASTSVQGPVTVVNPVASVVGPVA